MRKSGKHSLLVLAVLLLMIFAAGCGQDEPVPQEPDLSQKTREFLLNDKRDEVMIYLQLRDGGALTPVKETVAPTQEAPRMAVDLLLSGSKNELFENLFPPGIKLRDIYLKEGDKTVYLVLSKHIRAIDNPQRAQAALDSLVWTLTEFPNIDSVQLLIDDQEPQALDNIDISKALQRPKIINPAEENIEIPVKVYFVDSQAMHLVPVTVNAPSIEKRARLRTALLSLIMGPVNNKYNLFSTVWKGTSLKSFSIDEEQKMAIVDLSKEVVGYGGGHTAENIFIKSLVQTVTEIDGIEKVQLLIEGEKLDYLPEGTVVNKPLSRNDL